MGGGGGCVCTTESGCGCVYPAAACGRLPELTTVL